MDAFCLGVVVGLVVWLAFWVGIRVYDIWW